MAVHDHTPERPEPQRRRPSLLDPLYRWRQARRSGRSGSTTGGNFGPATGSGDVHTPSENRAAAGNPGRGPDADEAVQPGSAAAATSVKRP